MEGVIAAMESHDFDVWSAAVGPRLAVAFYVAEDLTMDESRSLADDTVAITRENWSEVCALDESNTVWAYRAAFKLLEQRRMAGSIR